MKNFIVTTTLITFDLNSIDANPDRDTTEQFKMLNRAYEVLRDPKLRDAFDRHGSKGIGTSAASDGDTMRGRQQQKPNSTRPSSPGSTRNAWASESTARTNGYASNFGNSWTAGSKTNSEANEAWRKARSGGASVVDPFSTGKRTPYTPKQESEEWSTKSYQDPGFRPRPSAKTTTGAYQSGPKVNDPSAYYGDMGSVHAQRGAGTRFEDKLFDFQDGVKSGEAFFGRGPKFGKDVLINIELDAKTASVGGKKTVEVKHMETCGTCSGSGTKDASSTVQTCRHCGGSGYTIGASMMREACPVCLGTGHRVTNPCQSCKGLGMQEATQSLEIIIPREVEHGYTLRVAGQGDCGPSGGPNGDLYVCFKLKGGPTAKRPVSTPTSRSMGPRGAPKKRVSSGLKSDQQNVGASWKIPKNPPKTSPGLAPDQPRVKTSVSTPGRTPPKTRTTGLRADQGVVKPGFTPKAQAQRSANTPSGAQTQRRGVGEESAFGARSQRATTTSTTRKQPQRVSTVATTANRRIVEKSRVSPAQAQANRFGSTRTVSLDMNSANMEANGQPPRRRRLRGLRNFVSNIWSR